MKFFHLITKMASSSLLQSPLTSASSGTYRSVCCARIMRMHTYFNKYKSICIYKCFITLTSSEPNFVLNFTSITASTLRRIHVFPSSSFSRKRDAIILLGWVAKNINHYTLYEAILYNHRSSLYYYATIIKPRCKGILFQYLPIALFDFMF